MTREHHTIEIFSAGCPLCTHMIDDIGIGKCQGCKMIVYNVNRMGDELKRKMRNYGINSVPTVLVDGRIKVVGMPDFPWICGDDLYRILEQKYPLRR